jgi:hypothetical protein
MIEVIGFSPAIAERSYDNLMPRFSATGQFEPQALATLQASFADLKSLEKPVAMSTLYTEAFLAKAKD